MKNDEILNEKILYNTTPAKSAIAIKAYTTSYEIMKKNEYGIIPKETQENTEKRFSKILKKAIEKNIHETSEKSKIGNGLSMYLPKI